jgi:hypothetical protein
MQVVTHPADGGMQQMAQQKIGDERRREKGTVSLRKIEANPSTA